MFKSVLPVASAWVLKHIKLKQERRLRLRKVGASDGGVSSALSNGGFSWSSSYTAFIVTRC